MEHSDIRPATEPPKLEQRERIKDGVDIIVKSGGQDVWLEQDLSFVPPVEERYAALTDLGAVDMPIDQIVQALESARTALAGTTSADTPTELLGHLRNAEERLAAARTRIEPFIAAVDRPNIGKTGR